MSAVLPFAKILPNLSLLKLVLPKRLLPKQSLPNRLLPLCWLLALPLLPACGGGSATSSAPAPQPVPPLLPALSLPVFTPLVLQSSVEREFVLTLQSPATGVPFRQALLELYQQGLTQAADALGCQVNSRSCRRRFLLKLQLPAGVFQLDGGVEFRHNVLLSGDAAGTTIKLNPLLESDYGLRFAVFNRAEPVDVALPLGKGGRELQIDLTAYGTGQPLARLTAAGISVVDDLNNDGLINSAELLSRYQPGATVQLESDGQTSLPASQDLSRSWLPGQHRRWTKGELNRIVAVRATTNPQQWLLELEQPLLQDYPASTSRVRVLDMLEQAGVQQLTVERLAVAQPGPDRQAAVGDNIWFYHVRNVQINELHSQFGYGAQLNLQMVYGCHIGQSQFSDSWNYGAGGAGYGIDLGRHSRGCRIEDNQFQRLRHGVVSHYGSAAHVIGYNSFSDSRMIDSQGQTSAATDILFHGDQAVASLVEGNVLDSLAFDDVWGSNGPGHLVLRNCIRRSVKVAASSPGQYLVGNIMAGSRSDWPENPALVTAHGNYLAQAQLLLWQTGYHQQLPDSAYWSQTPVFAKGWQLPRFTPTQPGNCP